MIIHDQQWECPLCDYVHRHNEPFFYSTGHDRDIEELKARIDTLEYAIYHLVTEHFQSLATSVRKEE